MIVLESISQLKILFTLVVVIDEQEWATAATVLSDDQLTVATSGANWRKLVLLVQILHLGT